ncbi:hypothetical protein J28TS4_11700 [Paenibacillus lautus]|jgi:hypothetical protein|nr:hypothetical protein J28TS4_11700 [Paenibacillus lautus]
MAASVTAVPRRITEENTAAVTGILAAKDRLPITNAGTATKVMAIIKTEEAAQANHSTSYSTLPPSTWLHVEGFFYRFTES